MNHHTEKKWRGILFDLDGTLMNTAEEIGRASCRERV